MKIYSELAKWWPLFSPAEEYAEEAVFYQRELVAAGEPPCRTLLELGSGGGNNASHMKARFEITLTDVSEAMLDVSRALNPECEHLQGDMREIRLGRTFDCVFIHDAICYMTTPQDLRRAIDTAFVHCRPGGSALFAPDHLRENFASSTDHGGVDGDGHGLRFLEWQWDPDPADSTYSVEYAVLLRETDGSVRVEAERHDEGLFGRDEWLQMLSDAGFEARCVPFDHSELAPGTYEVFVCRRPR